MRSRSPTAIDSSCLLLTERKRRASRADLLDTIGEARTAGHP